jgi:hypothetical protein
LQKDIFRHWLRSRKQRTAASDKQLNPSSVSFDRKGLDAIANGHVEVLKGGWK